ncbi:MAG: VOC family protein [Pseudomonadota bacterium]
MTASHPLDASRWIDHVVLAATDPDRLAEFYASLLGLEVEGSRKDRTLRTRHGQALVKITEASRSRPTERVPGLFHTAFLLPSRGDLGAWLGRAFRSRAPLIGASDHGVSEALYLSDPEGNGIEIYADRPVADWNDTSGALHMPSEPLDIDALLAAETGAYDRAPDGTVIGHVHLSVPDLTPAELWASGADLSVTTRYPGAAFLSWDGYHHHVAVNTWGMRPAAPIRPTGTPGLAGIVIGDRVGAAGLSDLLGVNVVYEAADGVGHSVEAIHSAR